MNTRTMHGKKFAPAILVGVGVAAGVLLGNLGDARTALAQPGEQIKPENILSAGAQRNQMIAKLDTIEKKLAAIEAKLNAPLSVKVLEMPAMKGDK